MEILIIDVGGSHIKGLVPGHEDPRKFESGPEMTLHEMVKGALAITDGWRFDAVSIGYPGVVRNGAAVRDPHNLGPGWVGFDFKTAFSYPVKVIQDAAMQALGAHEGGTMLFLGLGTGLGSALIVNGVIQAMGLGHLRCGNHSALSRAGSACGNGKTRYLNRRPHDSTRKCGVSARCG